MGSLGLVRIGQKAPQFQCDAVVKGIIEEVTLESYISDKKQRWLILLFIPAAFSFVCPTEVLAFQNCLDEFHDRNCEVLFVSVDTKHSLWHWQNVPRQYGGLGQIDIALLSDASHKMSRDYGVLIEEEGVCLRGMYILDDSAVVQQVTLNNLTVGRSVLEALRLLEAFQAVAKHGVLCPIDWKPSTKDTSDTLKTISNTLVESYDERLANLQKEFADIPVTDLDAKHKQEENQQRDSARASPHRGLSASSQKQSTPVATQTGTAGAREQNKDLPRTPSLDPSVASSNFLNMDFLSRKPADRAHSTSAPASAAVTPTPTPSTTRPPMIKKTSFSTTARHSRGHHSINPHQSPAQPVPPSLSNPKHKSLPPAPLPKSLSNPSPPHHLHQHALSPNTYESRRGSHVVLEFADPTSFPQTSTHTTTPGAIVTTTASPSLAPARSAVSAPALSRSQSSNFHAGARIPYGALTGSSGCSEDNGSGNGRSSSAGRTSSPGQTRLQMTFEAIKKLSAGLASPRIDFSAKKRGEGIKSEADADMYGAGGGYFDVVVEGVET